MTNRIYKIQDLLHKEIAQLLLKDIQNPILDSFITISGVSVSKDLKNAEVFFTTLDTKKSKIQDELNKSKNFIKKELSKRIHLKRVPNLKFTYDKTAESSQKIDKIIKSVTIPEK
ncbi:MAG: ribosome-binding factor A [Gammaproteobacteria bacterium]|nr:ribosome-binding factor A [Gammaproteobacteria bacterium]|tara:strand:+ start:151855 stop:152199 length:345 start_codon:yes stop_codon:yes gene_type:complete